MFNANRPLRPSALPVAPTRRAVPAAPTPVARPAATGYRASVAALQAKLDAESALPLQPGERSVLRAHPTPPAKGTIVMYHGFTAGTWQYEQLAQKAFDDGYNVYIPRLPGHGLVDARGTENPAQLVKSEDWAAYSRFGEATFQDAKSLGGPISVMGLSVGGAVALDVAEKHPEVVKDVVYAPFLRPFGIGWAMDLVHALDKVTFGYAGKLLDRIPYGWGAESTRETAAGLANGGRAGHSKFHLGNIYAAEEFGRQVIAHAGELKAPVQFFTSGADTAAEFSAIRTTYEKAGGAAKNGFYEYPKAEGIPHAMLSPREDHGKGQTPKLYDMTMEFLDKGLRARR